MNWAAIVWLVLMVFFLWELRRHHAIAYLAASAAALVCTVGNPLFLFAPFGLLIGHFYNGEPGRETAVWFRYLLYPILLTLIGLVGTLLF